MYKILIVEDEPLVRESLVTTIDYSSIGFCIIDNADNGLNGVKSYIKYKPDVIITDIRMDICDGLKMLEEISKLDDGHCQFIILSAYNNFEYMKSSIALGVVDYLLKPIKNDELIRILLKVKSRLDKMQKERMAVAEVNDKLSRLKEDFIRTFFINGVHGRESNKLFDVLGLDPQFDSFYSVYATMSGSKPALPDSNICNYIGCNIENDSYGFIIFNDEKYSFALKLAEQNGNAKIGVSNIFSDISDLSVSVENAHRAYQNCKNGVNVSFGIQNDTHIYSIVAQAKQFVKENYSKSISTKDVADALGFSESHFMLLFKKATGTSFSSYLLSYRMEVAIMMMKTQRYRIYEICNSIGYKDIKSFRNAFKKYTGMSPVDYKNKLDKRKDEIT
ncbi:MAG: response regulator [Clostridia bacterium]|nr:response regulator [Clostridia bacterium]